MAVQPGALRRILDILANARAIAVLGAHPNPSKAAYYVPSYLKRAGYGLYPVNPVYAGSELFGRTVLAHLRDLPGSIGLVNVFRHSSRLAAYLNELPALNPQPKVVWLQRGISDNAVASALITAGVEVVQDRCILADHQQLL